MVLFAYFLVLWVAFVKPNVVVDFVKPNIVVDFLKPKVVVVDFVKPNVVDFVKPNVVVVVDVFSICIFSCAMGRFCKAKYCC